MASIMPLAMPCPRNPQNIPAKLYSRNFTPRQAALFRKVYERTPGTEPWKTALGTFSRSKASPAEQNILTVKSTMFA